jgi:hypothetical protein
MMKQLAKTLLRSLYAKRRPANSEPVSKMADPGTLWAGRLPSKPMRQDDAPWGVSVKRRSGNLDELVRKYRKLRFGRGDEARTLRGMRRLGQTWLYYQAKEKYDLTWTAFKGLAGYDVDPAKATQVAVTAITRVTRSLNRRDSHGPLARVWLLNNGLSCLVHFGEEHLGVGWDDIVQTVFRRVPKRSEERQPQPMGGKPMPALPQECERAEELGPSPRPASLDESMDFHASLVMRYGRVALTTTWLMKHGCSRIYNHAKAAGMLPWGRYLFELGRTKGFGMPSVRDLPPSGASDACSTSVTGRREHDLNTV